MGEILKKRLKQNNFENEHQEAVLNLFVCANHLKLKASTLIEDYGITFSQYNVLRILKGKYPEGYARCEIIHRMIEPSPDVTRLIDRLEKQKLVERYNSGEDRRHSLARITEKGILLIDAMYSHVKAFDDLFSSKLTKDESLELSRILEKIYKDEIE